MARKPIIAGNWKMNKTVQEARSLVSQLAPLVANNDQVETVVCPPFTALAAVGEACEGTNLVLGAQDLYWESEGAFTGEVSGPMLADLGCRYVIVGHSERRHVLGESDGMVNRKLLAAFQYGLVPILCVGETLDQREGRQTFEVCQQQLDQGLTGISPEEAPRLVVAYEPVWAIGTGRNAEPGDAQEVIGFLRGRLADLLGPETADQIRIQYGGSVKPENVGDFMAQRDIDGALVGGASLKATSFADIVNYSKW